MEDSRVKSVRDFKINRDNKYRRADIDFTIIDGENKPMYMQEVVAIG